MKNLLIKIIPIILIFIATSCSDEDGDYTTKTIEIEAIHNIELDVDADVYLKIGNLQSITLEGSNDAINNIDYSVSEGKLSFTNIVSSNFEYKSIYITVKSCDSISISNNANLYVKKEEFDSTFVLTLSGNASAEFNEVTYNDAIFLNYNNSDLYLNNVVGEVTSINAEENCNVDIVDVKIENIYFNLKSSSDLNIKNLESNLVILNADDITDSKIHTLISDSTAISLYKAADVQVENSTSTGILINQYNEAQFDGKTLTVTNGELYNESSKPLTIKVKKASSIYTVGEDIQLLQL